MNELIQYVYVLKTNSISAWTTHLLNHDGFQTCRSTLNYIGAEENGFLYVLKNFWFYNFARVQKVRFIMLYFKESRCVESGQVVQFSK